MASHRIHPFEQSDQTEASWRDVAGAWAVVILFVVVALVGIALDRAVTIGP